MHRDRNPGTETSCKVLPFSTGDMATLGLQSLFLSEDLNFQRRVPVAKRSALKLASYQRFKSCPLPRFGTLQARLSQGLAALDALVEPFPLRTRSAFENRKGPVQSLRLCARGEAEDSSATSEVTTASQARSTGGASQARLKASRGPAQRRSYPAGLPSLQVTDVFSRR